jgi:hypothetical protein
MTPLNTGHLSGTFAGNKGLTLAVSGQSVRFVGRSGGKE